LAAHYAPRATLRLLDTAALQVAVELLLAPSGTEPRAADPDSADAVAGEAAARALAAPRLAVYSRGPRPHAPTGIGAQAASPVWWREMPGDPDAAAHELFAALREFDDRQIELIWVEAPPADARWDGVRDRLQRAAAAA
ncbi:MAG: Sua5 family C-terminal domain-containing protein, partial [Leptothrix sp. (in: b-proteobacteria)]